MTDLLKDVVGGLALVAAGAAIALFLLAVAAMLLATYRVTVLRRPFVLTFAGSDEARGPLTALFALQLLTIEREWTGLASSLQAAKDDLAAAYENAMQAPVPSAATGTPIADGADLPDLRAAAHDQDTLAGVVVGPRPVGDETIEYVLELAGANSLADAELGQVTVASRSPTSSSRHEASTTACVLWPSPGWRWRTARTSIASVPREPRSRRRRRRRARRR